MTRSQAQTLPLRSQTGLVRRLTATLGQALLRRRERHLLAQLDPHLLRDIGLSAEEARRECAKPFWQP